MKDLFYKEVRMNYGFLAAAGVAVAVLGASASTYTLGKHHEAICKDSAVFVMNDRLYRCEPVRVEESQRA
jgi:hypothetical protein